MPGYWNRLHLQQRLWWDWFENLIVQSIHKNNSKRSIFKTQQIECIRNVSVKWRRWK